MNETPDATTRVPVEAAPSARPPRPARPLAEVRADIVEERAALGASFTALRTELDDAVDTGKQRLGELGRRARVVAPLAGAALAVALFLRSRARDRR